MQCQVIGFRVVIGPPPQLMHPALISKMTASCTASSAVAREPGSTEATGGAWAAAARAAAGSAGNDEAAWLPLPKQDGR